MKGECHHLLGRYLVEKYMAGAPRRYAWAFRIGCIEPDRNPATYLKGSLRSELLRGHNWANAERYISRTADKLERREKLRLLDYYLLGRLIHYTTDAFTFAHNGEIFGDNLKEHNDYERALKSYFPRYLSNHRDTQPTAADSVSDAIRSHHNDYIRRPSGVHTDSRFSVVVCTTVFAMLVAKDAVPSL